MSVDQFREIRVKAGGLIILLPENVDILSFEEKQVCKKKLFFFPDWHYHDFVSHISAYLFT